MESVGEQVEQVEPVRRRVELVEAAAYIGSTLAPPLFGALSTVTGLWILPLLLAVLAALGLLMSERLNQLASRRRQPSESANSASV